MADIRRKYVIERDVPGAGAMTDSEARAAARKSNVALPVTACRIRGKVSTFPCWIQQQGCGMRLFALVGGVAGEDRDLRDP